MTPTAEKTFEKRDASAGERSFLLDGRRPDRIYAPRSEAEAVEAVREASALRLAIVPWGGGTAIQTGFPLTAERWAVVETSAMDSVLEYSPDDMVVTAAAGAPLDEVQALLKAHNQFLPIDPPFADRATLGGVTATNGFGLYRATFGLPRDRLLGAKIVLANGDLVKAGAKVVKNVAGYDLGKLVAGSWGTLGLVTEATYKTNPIPAAHLVISFSGTDMSRLVEGALQVRAKRLEPLYLFVSGPASPRLLVGLMGGTEAVEWQDREITRELADLGLRKDVVEASSVEEERAARTLVAASVSLVKLRISSRPSDLAEMLAWLGALCDPIGCHVGLGVVEAALSPETVQRADVLGQGPLTNAIRNQLPAGANLIWTALPSDWKVGVDVWGSSRGNLHLLRRIKSAFDPDRLFSPGRFMDRI